MYGFIEFYSYTLCNFHVSPIVFLYLFNYNMEKLVHENRFSDSKTGAIFVLSNTK